jgi:hypothetical protein
VTNAEKHMYARKLQSAQRAIERLAKLAFQIRDRDLAAWLIEGDKLGECDARNARFISEWLECVCHDGIYDFEAAKPPRPGCIVCGKDSRSFDKRSHTRYCSSRCRQKAYRKRNGSSERTSKQTVTDAR